VEAVPEHLVVIGGSYIGLEFAQMYRRFGAEVTVVEKAPRLIAREDEEVSEAVRDMLEREGIAIRLAAECISFAKRNNGTLVGVDCTAGDREVLGSDVLLAVGRTPNTHDLGLDSAGVAMDVRGYITVDDRLETNVPGIWALGDCNGRGAFTHTAYNDYEIVADNLLKGTNRRVSDRIATYALFVDPPLGRVGMTEKEAVATGRPILVGRRPMTRVGRAVERDETLGLMKIVVAGDTQEILGAAILGVGGDEAVHSVLDMMAAGAPVTTLEHTMHIHPTVAELIPTIAGKLVPSDLPS
jgi:pyruvate/2-oxoglutarate dehydrogenase complex dihydrolipoamide dehydrogenase (E3) component